MSPRRALVFLALLLCNLSCLEKRASPPATTSAPSLVSKNHFIINSDGDTVLTGIPVLARGKRITQEMPSQPNFTFVKGRPKAVAVHTNIHPVGKPRVMHIPEVLTVLTPGKDGILKPVSFSTQGTIVPAQQQKPVAALPLRIKDDAFYNIQFLDVDQGMISSYIRFLQQDSNGYLWFGTSYGISRYDGSHFIHYTIDEGLSNNTVLAMLEDSQGDLWFGMHTGLTRYDGNRFVHYMAETGWSSHEFKAMLEDSQGNHWFGTGGGLVFFDGQEFTHYTIREGLIHDNILSMMEDNQGNLWLGTSEGLSRFDGVSFTHFTTKEGLTHNTISSMLEDRQGVLWFGTGDGLNRFDGTHFTHFTTNEGLAGKEVRSILEDSRGELWFGTSDGVSRYDGAHFANYTTEEGLSNNEVRSILEDSQGNLWFGTGGGGVNRLDNTSFHHFTAAKDLSDNSFLCILEDRQGNIWFGVGGGLIRYDGEHFNYYTSEQGLTGNQVRSILEDSQGNLWLGTSNGVSRFDGTSFTHYTTENGLIDNVIRSILEDRQGNLWFGSWNGLTMYQPTDGKEGTFTRFTIDEGLPDNYIRSMLLDSRGDVWFGTSNGATRYNGTNFTHYTTNEGLSGNDIRCMLADSRGYIWFGTGGNGLSCYDGRGFTNYTTHHGLSNNFVWSLLEDRQGDIWMSTEKGITLMKIPADVFPARTNDQDSLPAPKFYTFTKESGLKRLDFQANSVCLDRKNRIWWGSVGLVMLDLNQFRLPTQAPKNVRLTHIEVNQQFVDYRRLGNEDYRRKLSFGEALAQSFDSVVPYHNYPTRITLPHQLNHLTFHFSAIDWTAPRKIQYQYLMEGLDATWSNPSPEPRVDYRNLSHGTYTFKVRAIGEAQRWSEPFSYSFTILPPWWLTWWAYSGYFLWVSGLIYGIYYFVKKRWILQSELKREQEESVRLKELDAFKTRLYTNLTHEFRTPLTIILGMTEQLQRNPKAHLSNGLSLIRQNGGQLLLLINQLLDLSKLENKSFRLQLQQGDIIPFLHYVTDSFYSYANSKNLSLQFFTTVEKLVMDYDPEQIKQVLNNLLSNAIKFTPSSGKVIVRSARQRDSLQIEVSDTGIGIAPEELIHIFDRFYQVDASTTRRGEGTGIGLTHTQELVKLMGGEITVQSEVQKGTTFKITLPIRQGADTPKAEPADLETLDTEKAANGSLLDLPLSQEGTNLSTTNPDSDRPLLLIIEDNPDVVTYLKTCLGDSYQLEVAFNGKIGIEKALENIPDIIISDVMMPEKDGYEVCELLKNDERTSHIPIILLTAKADAESRISGLKTGADAYLYKPFNEEELLVRLEAMIRNRMKLQAYFARKFQHGFIESDLPQELDKEDAFIERVRAIVEENYFDENFALPQLCQKLHMSRSQLYRKMKALIDTPPSDFIRTYRLEKAKVLLNSSDLTVSEVAWRTGFKDLAHFSKAFLEEFGYSPSSKEKS